MKKAFLSEAAAYRFVLLTLGHLAAIDVAAQLGGVAAGLMVFGFLVVVLLARFALRRRVQVPPPLERPGRRPGDGRRWVLVVANEAVDGERLRDEIDRGNEPFQGRVLVICPALNSRLRHWVSDEDEARTAARARLRATIDGLAEAGIDAHGEIGDASPLQAIADALWGFAADEVIIATAPAEHANWLARDLVTNARKRFALPITQIGEEQPREQAWETTLPVPQPILAGAGGDAFVLAAAPAESPSGTSESAGGATPPLT